MNDDPIILIIAGSRSIQNGTRVSNIITNTVPPSMVAEVVTGGAEGVDTLAKRWVFRTHYEIEYTEMPANWDEQGKAAGPIRNEHMAEYGDELLAIWDGESPGTRDMIDAALDAGLDVTVKVVDPDG